MRRLYVVVMVASLAFAALGCTLEQFMGSAPSPGGASEEGGADTAPPPVVTAPEDIFLVALEDNGASGDLIGCGDSLIPIIRGEPYPAALEDHIARALADLFSIKDQFYGQSGLYNSLWQSDLVVEEVRVDADGLAVVLLSGTYLLSGVCDTPRFQSQIERTVLQFDDVNSAAVYIDDVPLEHIVSGR